MISTSWTALPCLTMLFKVNLLLFILLSTGMRHSTRIGLETEFILAMLALLRHLQNRRLGCKTCLPQHRRQKGRTLNEHLECCKQDSIS